MIFPTLSGYKFVKVVDYSDMDDLGRPYSNDIVFSGATNGHYYRNNPWMMKLHDGIIYIGAGNGINSKPGDNAPGGWGIRGIDVSDDSILEFPTTNMNAREIAFFQVIEGQMYIPDADSANDNSSYVYRVEDIDGTLTLVRYQITSARNHNYYIHKCRRNGRWISGHGLTAIEQNIFTSRPNFEDFPRNWDSFAGKSLNPRGIGILEFGPNESSTIVCLATLYPYGMGYPPYNQPEIAGRYPSTNEVSEAIKYSYEFNPVADSYTPLTNYYLSGLDRNFTNPRYRFTNTNEPIFSQSHIVLEKLLPVDNDTYLAVIGKGVSTSLGPRFEYPGDMRHEDLGEDGVLSYIIYGGVYYLTLGSTKSWPGAYGDKFIQCERALAEPEVTGRQWDYCLVGSDLYILTETRDLRCHIYKNGKKILTMTGLPTYARSFVVSGNDLYIGLGTDEYDPFRQNGTTLNSNSGRILKIANFEN